MSLNIVIRAADPAAAAEMLRALGVQLRNPDRPNPGRWHDWGRASLSVEACEPGEEPGLWLGVTRLPRALLAGAITTDPTAQTTTVDAGGVALALRRHDGPVHRPGGDQEIVAHAEVVLRAARAELRGAFGRHGVHNARLVGPELMIGRYEQRFALVLDGTDAAALAEIDAILAKHSEDGMQVEARAAGDLDAEILGRVDLLAWDYAP